MSNGSPLISIVIPTWNRPALVDRLLGVINANGNQDDLEIVVVDNASDEKNWEQLRHIAASHENVILHRNSVNIGMTPNWNKAIEYARGEWIGFICDDDVYKPDSIHRIREIIATVSGPCLILQNVGVAAESEWIEPGVQAANKIALPPASGQFWHRKLTDRLGPFDERIKYCPDAEFWLRLVYHYPVLRLRDYLVISCQHDTNYMWEAFRSPDFLQQVTLSITLSCQYTLGEKSSDAELIREKVEDGIWETLRTVLNNTFLRHRKMKNFPQYVLEFIRLSIKLGRTRLMARTIINLPVLRLKEIVRKVSGTA